MAFLAAPLAASAGRVRSVSLPNLLLASASAATLNLSFLDSLPDLISFDISGNAFSANLSAVSFTCSRLQSLNLANNAFSGALPDNFLSRCPSLRSLNLSRNAVRGALPAAFLSRCVNLQTLDLSYNSLSGSVPAAAAACPSLAVLNLAGNAFSGTLPAAVLSNCTTDNVGNTCRPSLSTIDLSQNQISGAIPEALFSNCQSLISITLSKNNISGSLPTSIANCASLQVLNLTANRFSSQLPEFLGQLPSLQKLHLALNQFVGEISASMVASLCSSLTELDISGNNLTGSLPETLSGCASLRILNVAGNRLSGVFPSSAISPLQSLEVMRAAFNGFTGHVPLAVMNSSKLRIFDMGGNLLTGSIPAEICPAFNNYVLEELLLPNNHLSGPIPSSLSNCTRLVILNLSFNKLTGSIPPELGNLPHLERISLWHNQLTGSIPEEIGNLQRLRNLNLNSNFLTGSIPASISQCRSLEWINLNSNQLSGEIPAELGQLQSLTLLQLANNSLIGPIPAELGNCSSLLWLDLNTNQLTGSIPSALGRHSSTSLSKPVMSGYQLAYVRNAVSSCKGLGMGIMVDFAGVTEEALLQSFPVCQSKPIVYVGGSLYDNPENRTIQYLDLSFNQISGNIPDKMGSWVSLISLALSHNDLSGPLPASFGNLTTLGVMDIGYNHLEGTLSVLSSCTLLVAVDVSNNYFSGEIPMGQLSTNPAQSFANNTGLCGPPLSPCSDSAAAAGIMPASCKTRNGNSSASASATNIIDCTSSREQRLNVLSMANSIVLAVLVAVLCVCAVLVWAGVAVKNRSRKCKEQALLSSLQQSSSGTTCNSSSGGGGWNLSGEKEPLSINVATFERPLRKLTFSQLIEATNGFSRESLVGTGGFGEVYRAELKDGTVVAIKKLVRFSYQGDREFVAEMETLGKIKHRNLVPLLGYCKVGEERLLVYEYMEGGSLEEVLHNGGGIGRERLNWDVRKQIAKGAARGLAFLHHNCIPHIIHRDMKSSNVLLDRDFDARVSDFGMARLISALDTHLSVSTLAGTPGYVPPEYYQSFRCTTKGDVYSYGVVLLELLTGKRPCAADFEAEGLNLVGWVKARVAESAGLEVLEPALRGGGAEFEMLQYLKIACLCLDDAASRRPSMLRVVAMLKELGLSDATSASSATPSQ